MGWGVAEFNFKAGWQKCALLMSQFSFLELLPGEEIYEFVLLASIN
jgi:hypothetical protein